MAKNPGLYGRQQGGHREVAAADLDLRLTRVDRQRGRLVERVQHVDHRLLQIGADV